MVTGGAGFIGSHLCEELLKRGVRVIAFDNLSVGSKDNLRNFLNLKNFELVVSDVRNKKEVFKQVKRADIVYHLAAVVGVSVTVNRPLETISTSVDGLKNVTDAAFSLGKKKVVFTSSSEVYGKNDEVPLTENISQSIFGSTKVTRWAYGVAKSLGEHTLWAYSEKGLPISIVRLFNSYGPRGINSLYANVVPLFIHQALVNKSLTVHGDGKQTRCFCFVEDTVEGILLCANTTVNEVVNIGSNKEISIYSLAKKIIRLTSSKSKIKFIPENIVYKKDYEGVNRRVPSIEKAKRLGFVPKTNLDEGLKETIAWTKERLKNQ